MRHCDGEPLEVVLEAVAIQVEVGGRTQLGNSPLSEVRGLEIDRVQVLLGQVVPRLFEPRARVSVGGVRDRRRQHPVADGLALVLRLELRLELRDLLRVVARELAEIPLAAEAVELHVRPPGDRLAEPLDRLEVDQLGVALVNRAQLEVRLQPRVVEVVLLVELGDEAIGAVAVAVELPVAERSLAHAA